MLRRALLWLLPALLVLALAHPAPSAAGVAGPVIERSAAVGVASLASFAFLPNDRSIGFSPWSDLDDDDRIVQAGAVPAWGPVANSAPSCRTRNVLLSSYPTSAAFPRGPPSA